MPGRYGCLLQVDRKMLDHRIYTFLKLCQRMNYRKTAEELNMTQPAVTQHIQYLEKEYGCRLFSYNGRTLVKTEEGQEMEAYARSLLYNDAKFRKMLKKPKVKKLFVGATKTIGDYLLEKKMLELLQRDDVELELIIDNTDNLLTRLKEMKLDILLIEGIFDKNSYGYELIRQEKFVGICSRKHPFAGRTVPLEELFAEHLILREEGSGTRAVWEQFLKENGYCVDNFARKSVISSFKLIEKAVSENCGISFVYESIAHRNPELAAFQVEGGEICHEFNYVFLKGTSPSGYFPINHEQQKEPGQTEEERTQIEKTAGREKRT